MLSSGSAIAKHGRRTYLFGSRRGGRAARRAEMIVGGPAAGEQIPLTSVRPGAGTMTSSDNDTDVDSSPLHAVHKQHEPNHFMRTRSIS